MNLFNYTWKPPGKHKKIRGKKKYFRNVLNRAKRFELGVEPDHWYNHWHFHPDWDCPLVGWNVRKVFLEAACIVFDHICHKAHEHTLPFQTFMILSKDYSSRDAVFFHTPNPYEDSKFPMELTGIDWTPVPELEELLSQWLSVPIKTGTQVWEHGTDYIVYSPGIGEPLSKETPDGSKNSGD